MLKIQRISIQYNHPGELHSNVYLQISFLECVLDVREQEWDRNVVSVSNSPRADGFCPLLEFPAFLGQSVAPDTWVQEIPSQSAPRQFRHNSEGIPWIQTAQDLCPLSVVHPTGNYCVSKFLSLYSLLWANQSMSCSLYWPECYRTDPGGGWWMIYYSRMDPPLCSRSPPSPY